MLMDRFEWPLAGTHQVRKFGDRRFRWSAASASSATFWPRLLPQQLKPS
jgi:hypothetical protein